MGRDFDTTPDGLLKHQHPVPPGVPLMPGFWGLAPVRLSALAPGRSPADLYLPSPGSGGERPRLELAVPAGETISRQWWEKNCNQGLGRVFVQMNQMDELAADLAERARLSLRAEDSVQQQALIWQEAVLAQLRLAFEGDLGPVDLGRRIAQTQRLMDPLVRRAAVPEALHAVLLADYSVFHHTVNVALTAVAFGRFLGLDQGSLLTLGLAALWHDLGMATLPRGLLEKPGPFTEDERGRMQRHPEEGYRLLLPVGEVSYDLLMIVRHHHENADGSGYPLGLVSDRIPWLARIVRLADAFEAMTHHRPYQAARSELGAARQLMEAMMNQFGRDLAPAFLEFLASPPLAA